MIYVVCCEICMILKMINEHRSMPFLFAVHMWFMSVIHCWSRNQSSQRKAEMLRTYPKELLHIWERWVCYYRFASLETEAGVSLSPCHLVQVVEAVLQYAEAKKTQTDPMKVRSFQLERSFFVFQKNTLLIIQVTQLRIAIELHLPGSTYPRCRIVAI